MTKLEQIKADIAAITNNVNAGKARVLDIERALERDTAALNALSGVIAFLEKEEDAPQGDASPVT